MHPPSSSSAQRGNKCIRIAAGTAGCMKIENSFSDRLARITGDRSDGRSRRRRHAIGIERDRFFHQQRRIAVPQHRNASRCTITTTIHFICASLPQTDARGLTLYLFNIRSVRHEIIGRGVVHWQRVRNSLFVMTASRACDHARHARK